MVVGNTYMIMKKKQERTMLYRGDKKKRSEMHGYEM